MYMTWSRKVSIYSSQQFLHLDKFESLINICPNEAMYRKGTSIRQAKAHGNLLSG